MIIWSWAMNVARHFRIVRETGRCEILNKDQNRNVIFGENPDGVIVLVFNSADPCEPGMMSVKTKAGRDPFFQIVKTFDGIRKAERAEGELRRLCYEYGSVLAKKRIFGDDEQLSSEDRKFVFNITNNRNKAWRTVGISR